jgi:hypothetical protein
MSSQHDPLILDKDLAELMDVFHVVLLDTAAHTVLPELLEVFGAEKVIKFMDLFAGITLKVPSREILNDSANKAFIFNKLRRDDSPENVALVAKEYGLTVASVTSIYKHYSEILRKDGKIRNRRSRPKRTTRDRKH